MTYQHQIGDNDGVLATARAMQDRHVVHSKDLVNARILYGYAHIRAGDRASGLKQIVNGFWHDPGSGLARNVVPLMVELGWLDHTNFLPCTPLQRSIGHRRGPMKTVAKDLPGIDAIEGLSLPESVGRLETVIWDWAPLLQSVSINAAVRTGSIERMIQMLERAKAGPELAVELGSQLAILQAFLGDADTAKSELKELGEANPESWQVWQRLSHVHWIHRDTKPALAAAERAVALLPDAPVLHGWVGMIQLRAKQVDGAVENLRFADAADTGIGSIALLYGQALSDSGDRPAALEAVRRARSLAPTEVRAAVLEAQLLRRTGRPHEAAATLRKLVDWQCATAKVFMMLVSVLQELDETTLAAEIAEIGSQRFPKHERIVALGQELAA
jgi:predicted Zn-dependent protease